MARATRKPYLAIVTWEDAFKNTCLDFGQLTAPHEPLLVECIGYVMRLDDDVCIVAAWYMPSTELWEEEYKDYHSIPRGMVRKITKLHA
jgi:hypothetical protein